MNKASILVVEDEALIAANLAVTLSSRGYTVHKPVATGEEAVRAATDQKPDLILMDIQLLGPMNGIEAAEKIRAIADIPIIYLTAHSDDQHLSQAKLTEPYGFIVKPAQFRELNATIDMALYKHALDRKLKESETRLQLALSGSETGMWELDIPSMAGTIDDRAARILGYRLNDIGSHHVDWEEQSHPDDLLLIHQRLADYLAGRTPFFESEHRMRTASGAWIWVLGKGKVTYWFPDGSPHRISGTLMDITRRKQTERDLVSARESLNEAHRLAHIGTWEWDVENDWVTWSGELYNIAGRDPSLPAPTYAEHPRFYTPASWDSLNRAVTRALTTGETYNLELELVRPDGGTRWVNAFGGVKRDGGGKVTGLHGTVQDITERKRGEEALLKSEEMLRDIIEKNPMSLQIVDKDGFTLKANHAHTILFGAKPPSDFSIFIDLLNKNPALEKLIRLVKSGEVVSLPDMYFNVHDSYPEFPDVPVWVRTIIFPLKDKSNKPERFVFMHENITDRKQAEEALRESEEKYRALFAAESDAIFVVDRETGIIIDCNDTVTPMYGYLKEEVIGQPNTSMSAEPDATRAATQEVKGLIPVRYHKRKDGSIFAVEITANVIPVKGRAVIVAAVRDITERLRIENALALAGRKLTLLSGITRHDINNQLTILQGYLGILKKKQADSSLSGIFDKTATTAQRIATMIQFTREYEMIGVHAPVWQDCHTLVETAAKEVTLGHIVMKNDLPAGMEVFADSLIIRVCYNLMDNAVRYGGKITTIRFSAEEHDGNHLIVCEDDGDGVAAEEKEKIFEQGFGKNTGLGLALAREILSITGITIRETGEPGRGARFEMTVPKEMWRTAAEKV